MPCLLKNLFKIRHNIFSIKIWMASKFCKLSWIERGKNCHLQKNKGKFRSCKSFLGMTMNDEYDDNAVVTYKKKYTISFRKQPFFYLLWNPYSYLYSKFWAKTKFGQNSIFARATPKYKTSARLIQWIPKTWWKLYC